MTTDYGADAPPTARRVPNRNWPRLAWLLAILLSLLALPSLLERIVYSVTRGRLQAEVESARSELGGAEIGEVSRVFSLVAKSIGPSVVHIDTVSVVGGRESVNDESAYYLNRPYVSQGQGSGVIVDTDGYILTNNHVIAQARTIEVNLSDGRRLPAEVVGADPSNDLAVIRIKSDGLIAAPWGNSDMLEVGSLVWAVGNPFGLDRSVTFGIISAKSRPLQGASALQDFLQTDAAVNPGNSGGPLVNIHGQIVGINTAIVGKQYQGISFSIPSNTAKDIYEQIRKNGSVPRAYLGVRLQDIDEDIARKLDLSVSRGALVAEVQPRSPAATAGVLVSDVVVRWNDRPIDSPTSLILAVARTQVGSKAKLVVVRAKREVTLDVLVEERPGELQN